MRPATEDLVSRISDIKSSSIYYIEGHLSSDFFNYLFLFYVYECFVCVYVCAPLASLAPVEVRERILDPLELELYKWL